MKINTDRKLRKQNLTNFSANEIEFNQELILRNTFKESASDGFELMFRFYYAALCSNAIRLVYDREVAEDIVSDVFEDFWERRCSIEMKISYKSYLYQSVRNRSLNYLNRSVNKNYFIEEINQEVLNKGIQITPEDIMNYHELIQQLEKAIGCLPIQSRRAFQLNRLDGKRYVEIADELNITVSAVERLISRALKKLKMVLSKDSYMSVLLLLMVN